MDVLPFVHGQLGQLQISTDDRVKLSVGLSCSCEHLVPFAISFQPLDAPGWLGSPLSPVRCLPVWDGCFGYFIASQMTLDFCI